MDLGEAVKVAGSVIQGGPEMNFAILLSAAVRFKVTYSADGIHYASLPDPFWVGGPGNDRDANTIHVGDVLVELSGGIDNSATDLQACSGPCRVDAQCVAGLLCFPRQPGKETPGCFGETPRRDGLEVLL